VKTLFILVSLIICYGQAITQTFNKNEIFEGQKFNSETDFIEYLNDQALKTRFADSTKCLAYLKKAEQLGIKSGHLESLALTYCVYTFYHRTAPNLVKAKVYVEKALKTAQLSKNDRALGHAYIQNANFLGIDHAEHINYLLKAESHLLKTTDYKRLASLYDFLAGQYGDLADHAQQLKFGNLGLKYALKATDKNTYANCMFQVANANHGFFENGNKTSKPQFDKILNEYNKVLRFLEKDSLTGKSIYSKTLYNLGSLFKDNIAFKNIDSAKHYFSLSKKYATVSTTKSFFIFSRVMLADIYINKNNVSAAETEINEIKQEFPDVNEFRDNQILANYYKVLSQISEKKNDFSNAYKYQILFHNLNESVYSFNRLDEIKKMESRYQNLKNVNQIKELQTREENRKWYMAFIAGLLLVSFLAIYLLLRISKIRQKQYDLETQLLNQQKNDAELQKDLQINIAENYRLETQLEIQQKEQYQKELMSSIMQLERKNDMMLQLKEKLDELNSSNTETKQISKLINENLNNEDDFDKFRKSLENVYPTFFNKLQVQSQNNLTQLDLRYCAYILLALSTKEIANLLFIEPASVRITRYRIKQKLNLDKEADLNKYIAALVL
jgi:DNA-binding CsgD family transcriptional regulator